MSSQLTPRGTRLRWSIAIGGVALLAVAGLLILNQAAVTVARSLGETRSLFSPGNDFWPIWYFNRLLITGQGSSHVYGRGISNPWPPPHEAFFAPLSYLPIGVVQALTIALVGAMIVLTVVLWSGREGLFSLRSGLWPILLSVPVFAVIWIDQVQAAAGLLALTVAVWAQRRERWWLVGVAAAFAMIRVANAVPVKSVIQCGSKKKLMATSGAIASRADPSAIPSCLGFPQKDRSRIRMKSMALLPTISTGRRKSRTTPSDTPGSPCWPSSPAWSASG